MSGKRNIKSFGKTYDYLRDPELRRKETNDTLMTIDSAEFSGVDLQYLSWRNIRFVNCDFAGAYQVKPKDIERALFEDCKFAGVFNLGKLTQVRFLRCLIDGTSHIAGDTGSKEVVFESCQMMGNDPDPNHWGSFGAYGDVTFISCKARWTSLTGETSHVITDCEFEDVDCQVSSESGGSAVLIEHCKLRGTFDMAPSSLLSLTIRDTAIDTLDLSNITVKGDIVMERVHGGSVRAIVKGAQRLIVKNCQFTPQPGVKFEFNLASNDAREILVEDTSITGENILVDIGGGAQTQSITFNRSKFTRLDLQYVHTQKLLLKDFEASNVRLNDARIGVLEFDQASFAYTLDLSNTQVEKFMQKGGTRLKGFDGLNLDGSNVKIN